MIMILADTGLLDSFSPIIMIVVYCLLGLSVAGLIAYGIVYGVKKAENKLKPDYPPEEDIEDDGINLKNKVVDGVRLNEDGVAYDDIIDETVDSTVTYYVDSSTTVLPKCFESMLKLANKDLMKNYDAIKNELMSFSGVRSKLFLGSEVFYRNGICARLKIKNGILSLYLNMQITQLELSRYNCKKITDDEGLIETPIELMVLRKNSVKHAKQLIYDMFATIDVYKYRGFVPVDYFAKYPKLENTVMAEKNLKVLEDNYGRA